MADCKHLPLLYLCLGLAVCASCNRVQTSPAEATSGDSKPTTTPPPAFVSQQSDQDGSPSEPATTGAPSSSFQGGGLPTTDTGIENPLNDLADEPQEAAPPLALDGSDLSKRKFLTLEPLTSDNPAQLTDHLQEIDDALTELVALSADNRIEKTLFLESGKRLGKMKLSAGEQLANSTQASEPQRTSGVKAQLIALSHLSSLNDVSAARQLESLARATANSADKDLAHQSRLVLVGFELQALQNGVQAKPQQLIDEIRGLFENFDNRTFPEFMMLQQAESQLSQLGYREEAQQVRDVLVQEYKAAEDASLRNEAWLYVTGDSQELQDYNRANQRLSAGLVQSNDEVLNAAEQLYAAFPSPQTLEQLAKSISNMEYLGFLSASQSVAELVQRELESAGDSASSKVTKQLLDDHQRRLALLNQPFPYAKLEQSLVDFKGNAFSADDLGDKVVLVNLWATWSIPCVEELDSLRAMQEKYAADGLAVVGIVMDDSPLENQDYILSQRHPWRDFYFKDAKGFESDFAKSYGVNIIPFVALADRNGNVVDLHIRGNRLEPAIRKALGKDASLIDGIDIPTQ